MKIIIQGYWSTIKQDPQPEGFPQCTIQCPKCRHWSGDDWEQCYGSCPMTGSPHFRPYIPDTSINTPIKGIDKCSP